MLRFQASFSIDASKHCKLLEKAILLFPIVSVGV